MSAGELLTVDFFAAHIGEVFEIAIESREPYRLELIEARGAGGESDAREPFSVLFRAEEESILGQRIYRLTHPTLDPLEVFLVPLGPAPPGGSGLLYEAAFS